MPFPRSSPFSLIFASSSFCLPDRTTGLPSTLLQDHFKSLLTCLCFGSFEQMTYNRPLRLTTEHPSQNFLTELRTFIPRVCSCDRREREAGFVNTAAAVAEEELACDEVSGGWREEWG